MLTGYAPFDAKTNDKVFRRILTKQLTFKDNLFEEFKENGNLVKDFIAMCMIKDP